MRKLLIENGTKPSLSFVFERDLGELDCDADADEGPRQDISANDTNSN